MKDRVKVGGRVWLVTLVATCVGALLVVTWKSPVPHGGEGRTSLPQTKMDNGVSSVDLSNNAQTRVSGASSVRTVTKPTVQEDDVARKRSGDRTAGQQVATIPTDMTVSGTRGEGSTATRGMTGLTSALSRNVMTQKATDEGVEESLQSVKEDPYAKAEVLDEQIGRMGPDGRYERVRVVKTDLKYPLVRVVDTMQKARSPANPHLAGSTPSVADDRLVKRVEMAADHVIVRTQEGVTEADLAAALGQDGTTILRKLRTSGSGIYLVRLPNAKADAVPQALGALAKMSTHVAVANPDYVAHTCDTVPNDPIFSQLWGMKNTGELPGGKGTVTADGLDYLAYAMAYGPVTSVSGVSGVLYDCGFGGTGAFPSGVNGNIALIQRGGAGLDGQPLTFAVKATNAKAAGAKAAIIYNNTEGDFTGTLGGPGGWIPVVSVSDTIGAKLKGLGPTIATVRIPPSTANADIAATKAWDLSTGSPAVLVGIIDSGVDYNHPDLASNMWVNPGESGLDSNGNDKRSNGIDDDGNGYIDDWHGWDFCNGDNDPIDDHYHGTHVAGTVGGVGNNGEGVAGVCWTVRMVALKFLSDIGSGFTSDATEAIYYATRIGVKLTSNSWGGGGNDQTLQDAIADAGNHGILFVAAAGNSGTDNDETPTYPASYPCENIIAVAATDSDDNRAVFSCYGKSSVDLAAPGVNIWSSAPGGTYRALSGTSMAAPHVSGVAALAWSLRPSLTADRIRNAVLGGADPIRTMEGWCVTGGRLNAYRTLLDTLLTAEIVWPVDDGLTGNTIGNRDQVLNPGEKIGLNVRAMNGLFMTVPNVLGTISVEAGGQYVQVANDTIRFGSLAPNGSSTGDGQYLLQVAQSCPTPYEVRLRHTLKGDGVEARSAIWRLTVYRSSRISGTVRLDGSPVGGVSVSCSGPRPMTVESAVDGKYWLTIVEGTNTIVAHRSTWLSSDAREVVAPTVPVTMDFDFRTATISGRVLDRNAGWTPLAGVEVTESGSSTGSVKTGVDGRFAISRVYGQTAAIQVTAAKSGYTSATLGFNVPPSVTDVVLGLGYSRIGVTPREISVTARYGETATLPLSIVNTGSDPLHWWYYSVVNRSDLNATADEWGQPGTYMRFIPFSERMYFAFGVAYDGKYLYVSDSKREGDCLFKYDAETGDAIEQFGVTGMATLAGLEWDGAHLWGIDKKQNRALAMDMKTRTVARSLPLPTDPTVYESQIDGIAVGPDAVWVIGHLDDVAYKLDKTTGALLGSLRSPAFNRTFDLQYRDGSLWVCTLGNGYYKIDPNTGAILKQVVFEDPGARYGICDDWSGHMWQVCFSTYKGMFLLDLDENTWLRGTPESGILQRGGSGELTLTFDSVKAGAGAHTAEIILYSDDPANEKTRVPVRFDVTTANGHRPPLANAGPDRTVTNSMQNGSEPIVLDGSGSTAPDGTIVSYRWTDETRAVVGTTVRPQLNVKVGLHAFALTVTDNAGAVDQDTVIVRVLDGSPNASPVANAGSDQTVTDQDSDGVQSVTLDGSQSTDVDGFIVIYTWYDEMNGIVGAGPRPGVELAIGVHTLTLVVEDNRGATASSTVRISVLANPNDASVEVPGSINVTAQRGVVKVVTLDLRNGGGEDLVWRVVPDIVDMSKLRLAFNSPVAKMEGVSDDGTGLWFSEGLQNTLMKTTYDGRVVVQRGVPASGSAVTELTGQTAYDTKRRWLWVVDIPGYTYGFWFRAVDTTSWTQKASVAFAGLFPSFALAVDDDCLYGSESACGKRGWLRFDISTGKQTGVFYPPVIDQTYDWMGVNDLARVRDVMFVVVNGGPDSLTKGGYLEVIVPDYDPRHWGDAEVLSYTKLPPQLDALGCAIASDHGRGLWMKRHGSVTYDPAVYKLGDASRFWLRVGQQTGTTAGGDMTAVSLVFDGRECEVGTYSGRLRVSSNDPGKPHVIVPVTFQVTGGSVTNQPPTAAADSWTTDEETAVDIDVLANDRDPDGDRLMVASVSRPSHGLAMNRGGFVSYKPDIWYNGSDAFTYSITDANGGIATGTVSVIVQPALPPPWRHLDVGYYWEGKPDSSVSYSSDTFTLTGLGFVSGSSDFSHFAYRPLTGDGQIVARVTGIGGPSTAEGSVVLRNVAVGAAVADSYGVEYVRVFQRPDNRVAMEWRTTADSGVTTTAFKGDAGSGNKYLRLTRIGNVFTGYYSPDGATWIQIATVGVQMRTDVTVGLSVMSGNDTSVATALFDNVSLIGGGNQPPTCSITSPANGATFTAPASITIQANASDVDGTIAKVEFYQCATKLGEDATSPYAYTWSNVVAGSYTLTVKATDNSGAVTASAGVNVTVSGGTTNRAPVATNVSVTTAEDTAKTVALSASDPDGDALTYAIVTGPVHGSLGAVSGSNVTYTPAANYNGADSFTFRVNDGKTNSSPATVSITVTSVNDAPVCSITSPVNGATFMAPATIAITANASDVDGTIAKVEVYQGATKLGEDTTSPYEYVWSGVTAGSYTLTVKATDTNGAVTTSAGVNVVVNPAVITLKAFASATPSNGTAPLTVQFAGSATGGNPGAAAIDFTGRTFLSYAGTNQDMGGTLTVTNGGSTVRLAGNTWKAIAFAYTIKTNTMLEFDFMSGAQGEVHGIGFDTQYANLTTNPSLVFQVYGTQVWGAQNFNNYASSAPGWKKYTIPVGQYYTGAFPYLVLVMDHDIVGPTGESVFRNVKVYEAGQGGGGYTFAWDFQNDGTVDATTSNATFTYTAAGTYTAKLTVGDGTSIASTNVTIIVTQANRPPVANAQSVTTAEDTPKAIVLTGSDPDGNPLTFAIVTGPAHGSLGAVSGSNVVYTPAANYNGADSFTFRVNDGRTNSAPATVSITVTAVNDAPVCSITSPANGATFTAPANITIQATASDVDGTIAKVEFFQGATKLGEDTTSPYAYTWANVAAGSYTLTAKATDTNGATKTSAGVNVTVNPAGGGSNVTVIATCDNAYELYVNGVLKGTGNNWQQSQTYSAIPLQPGRNAIAVKGIDQGGVAGFLAETIVNGVRSGSSANWKVSLTGPAGWTNAVFDDSTWVVATDYGAYGVGPWNKGVGGMPSDTPARWIWSSDANNHDTVYFRCVIDLPGGSQNQPPVALAGVDPINGTTLDEYYFWGTDSYDPDGTVTGYQWTVNGGVVSTAAEFLWTFDVVGTYDVVLTVTDNKGANDSDLVQVQVTEPSVTVSVDVPDSMAGEPGLPEGSATIRVKRTGSTSAALTVNVAFSGDASNGVDYAAIANSVVIPAGAVYRDILISPLADALDESDEMVILTVLSGTGYTVDAGTSAGLVLIKDQTYGTPVVSAEATDAVAKEPMQTTDKGTIKVSRTGSCHVALTVYCTLGGTAVNGVDYSPVTVPMVLAVGQSSKILTIAPLADGVVESNETVVLTLTSNASYQIAAGKGSATVTIQDATVLTTPVVSVVATDADAQEPAGGVLNYGYIRFARTTRFHETLTVNCTVGGTASNGVDYVMVIVPIVFAVGEGIKDISIRPLADGVAEGVETAVFTLTAGTGYTVDAGKASTTVNIRD